MARDFLAGDGATGLVDPLEFHPCDTPRGMMYYKMDVLTDAQQKKLNGLKRRTVVEDEKYLAKHPQVRACVAVMIREVLKERPRSNIHDTIARYFAQPRTNIEADISGYINSRRIVAREGDSHVDLLTSATSLISQFDSSMDKVTQTMSVDITRSFRELGKHKSEQEDEASPLERDLPDEKITELFIRTILTESLEASLLYKEIEDTEEILRIESYRRFYDSFIAEDTRSQNSAGFATSHISKPEVDEVGEILEELIQKVVGSVVDQREPEVDEVRARPEVEVEEIREIVVSLLESVEKADVGTGVESAVEEKEAGIDDEKENLDLLVAEGVRNLKREPKETQGDQNAIEIEDEHHLKRLSMLITEKEQQNIEEKPVATEDEQHVKYELTITEDEQNLKEGGQINEDVQRLKRGSVVVEGEQNLKGEVAVNENAQNLQSEPLIIENEQNLKNE